MGVYAPNPYNRVISDVPSNVAGVSDLATFRNLITAAYSNNTGGVLNFDNPVAPIAFGTGFGDGANNPVTVNYGAAHSNAFQYYRSGGTAADGFNANNNQGTFVVSGASSGGAADGYMGIQGTASWSITLVNPATAFGLTALSRNGSGTAGGTMTVHYSDGSIFTSSTTSIPANSNTFFFYGFVAPTGKLIKSLDWANGASTTRFDDLGFVLPAVVQGPLGTQWKAGTSGSWDIAANWTAGIPNSSGVVATLGSPALGGPATIDLPGARTVGTLNFSDANNAYTLATTGAGSLALNNGASSAAVTVLSGSHTISVPVSIPAAGAKFDITRFQDVLTVSGDISGPGNLTKAGPGTVILTGTGTFAGTTVTDGKLQVGNGGASGSIGTGNVSVTQLATLAFNKAGDINIPNNISGANGFVQQDGTGVMTFSGANTFGTGSGGIVVNAGQVKYQPNGGIPVGVNLSLNGTGAFEVDGNNVTIGGLDGTAGAQLRDSNTTPGVTTLTLAPGGTLISVMNGQIVAPGGRSFNLIKTGSGTAYLQRTNAITDDVRVLQGDLGTAVATAFGTGTIIVAPTSFNPSDPTGTRARLIFGGGAILPNNIRIQGISADGSGVLLMRNGNESITFAGTIDVADGVNGTGGVFAGPSISGTMIVAGPVNQLGTTPVSVRSGNVRFSFPGGTATGVTDFRIDAGTVSLGAENGLPPMANVDLANTANASLDLLGFNQSVASVFRSAGTATGNITSTVGNPNFSTTSNSNFTYPGNMSGGLNYVKAGTGTATFSGALTYTGNTTVNAGKLIVTTPLRPVTGSLVVAGPGASVQLAAAPQAIGTFRVAGEFNDVNVAAGGVAQVAATNRTTNSQRVLIANTVTVAGTLDLTNNDAVIHGMSAASVSDLVKSWWNKGLRNGPGIASSLSGTGTDVDAVATLAVTSNDNGAGGTYFSTFDGVTVGSGDVLVKYTYLGDTNFDGLVDTTDLNTLIAGIRTGATGWRNGDTNYDGLVNADDLANITIAMRLNGATFGDSSGVSAPGGVVPEPSAIGLLLAGVPLLTRRRRR